MSDDPTVVVGGGISGLAAAFRLEAAGRPVVLLEGGDRVGGLIDTEEQDGYLMEWGPHSILGSSRELLALVEELGLSDELIEARDVARHRYILRRGKLRRLPRGPFSLPLTRAFGLRAKLRLLLDPLLPAGRDPAESVEAFFRRRVGREITDYVAAPFVSGVYGGLPGELEMATAFPELFRVERAGAGLLRGSLKLARERRRAGSRRGTFALRRGLGAIAGGLVNSLGDAVRTGTRVTALEPRKEGWRVSYSDGDGSGTLDATGVVLAVPARAAAELIEPFAPEAAQLLREIIHASLCVVQVGVARGDLARPLDGFGFLVPRREDSAILGAIWASAIFAERAPAGSELITIFMGGRSRPEFRELPEEKLRLKALDGLFAALGGGFAPEMIRFRRRSEAIPQYTIGHGERIDRIGEAVRAHRGLALAGNYLHGVSLESCVKSAAGAAEEVTATCA